MLVACDSRQLDGEQHFVKQGVADAEHSINLQLCVQAQRHQMLQARVGLQQQQLAVQKQTQQLHQAAQRLPEASLGLGVAAQSAVPTSVIAPVPNAAPAATPPAAQANHPSAMPS